MAKTEFPCPSSEAFSFSIVGYQNNGLCVSGLLCPCCPPAVSWLVSASLVWPSIKAMGRRRPSSHIGEKSSIGIYPALAYGNPASSVPCVGGMLGVVAPGKHRSPVLVFQRCRAVSGVPVPDVPFRIAVVSHTSAGLNVASNQKAGLYGMDPPAHATASPDGEFLDNRQVTEGVPFFKIMPGYSEFHRSPLRLAKSRSANSNTDAWLSPICSAMATISLSASSVNLKLVACFLLMPILYRYSRPKSIARSLNV